MSTKAQKVGRPPVDSEQMRARMSRDLIDRIDVWRREQPDLPGRPEAIRRLVEKALDAEAAQ